MGWDGGAPRDGALPSGLPPLRAALSPVPCHALTHTTPSRSSVDGG